MVTRIHCLIIFPSLHAREMCAARSDRVHTSASHSTVQTLRESACTANMYTSYRVL